MLRLRTLGSFGLSDATGANTSIPPHRLALLALLAAAGQRGIARDKILAYLWPESTPAKARASLEQMLHTLRASLDQTLALRGNPLRIDGEFATSDVADFRAALDAGDLERAVELYGGPFLDGFYLSGLPEFEEWLEGERAALAERFAKALERLAADATARGDHARAVRHLRSLGSVTPLSGRVACRLMEALAAAGDRDGALEVATRYAVRVREQLDAEPDPSVTALAAELRAPARANSVPTIRTEPLRVEAAADLRPASPSQHYETVAARRVRRRRLLFLAGAAALVVLATATWRVTRAPTLDPKRVLVGLFEDRTGDPAVASLVRRAASEIVRGLASTGLVHAMDAAAVSTEGARARDFPSLRSLARQVGAGSVVSGSISRRADSLEFDVTLTDVGTGDLLRPVRSVVRVAEEPTAAVALVAQRVMGGYATHFDPRFRNYAAVSQPATYDAYREFQTGIRLRWEKQWTDSADAAAVLEHFRRAIALDSAFMQPRLWVATVHRWMLGDCRVVESIATALREAGTHLLSIDQASIDRDEASCRGNPRGEYTAAQQILRDAPDLGENVWFVALAALGDNKPREVLTCLERLERTRDRTYHWRAGCWNLMMHAYHQLGQYRAALQLIDQMRVELPDQPLLERYQMRQWAALGDVARVNALINERLKKSSQEMMAGEDMLWIGEELRGHGHLAAGKALCERGVAWYATRPTSQQATVDAQAFVARLLYCAERWDQARVAYERLASEDSAETGWESGIYYRTRLAALAARRGDSAEVARVGRWFAARDSLPRAACGLAVLAAFRGDRTRALALFQFAWERGEPNFAEAHADPIFEPLRDYQPFHDLLYPKESKR
jgi:pentatricopeptide repeat protein